MELQRNKVVCPTHVLLRDLDNNDNRRNCKEDH